MSKRLQKSSQKDQKQASYSTSVDKIEKALSLIDETEGKIARAFLTKFKGNQKFMQQMSLQKFNQAVQDLYDKAETEISLYGTIIGKIKELQQNFNDAKQMGLEYQPSPESQIVAQSFIQFAQLNESELIKTRSMMDNFKKTNLELNTDSKKSISELTRSLRTQVQSGAIPPQILELKTLEAQSNRIAESLDQIAATIIPPQSEQMVDIGSEQPQLLQQSAAFPAVNPNDFEEVKVKSRKRRSIEDEVDEEAKDPTASKYQKYDIDQDVEEIDTQQILTVGDQVGDGVKQIKQLVLKPLKEVSQLTSLERAFNTGGALQVVGQGVQSALYQLDKGKNQKVDDRFEIPGAESFAGMLIVRSKQNAMFNTGKPERGKDQNIGEDLYNKAGVGHQKKFQPDATIQRIALTQQAVQHASGTVQPTLRSIRIVPNFNRQSVFDMARNEIIERHKKFGQIENFMQDVGAQNNSEMRFLQNENSGKYLQVRNRTRAVLQQQLGSDEKQKLTLKSIGLFDQQDKSLSPVDGKEALIFDPDEQTVAEMNKTLAASYNVTYQEFMNQDRFAMDRVTQGNVIDVVRPRDAHAITTITSSVEDEIIKMRQNELIQERLQNNQGRGYLELIRQTINDTYTTPAGQADARQYVNPYAGIHTELMNFIKNKTNDQYYDPLELSGIRLNQKVGDIDLLEKTVNLGRVELNFSPYATRTAMPLINSSAVNYLSPLVENYKQLMKGQSSFDSILGTVQRDVREGRQQTEDRLRQTWLEQDMNFSKEFYDSDYISDIILPDNVQKTILELNAKTSIQVGKKYGTGDMYDPFDIFTRDQQGNIGPPKDLVNQDIRVEELDLPSIFNYSNKLTYLLANASKAGLLFDIQYLPTGRKFDKTLSAIPLPEFRRAISTGGLIPYQGADEADTIAASHIINDRGLKRIQDQLKILLNDKTLGQPTEREVQCVLRAGAAYTLFDTLYGDDLPGGLKKSQQMFKLFRLLQLNKNHNDPLLEAIDRDNFMTQGGIDMMANYVGAILDGLSEDLLAAQIGAGWEAQLEKYTTGSFLQKNRNEPVRPHVFGLTQHVKMIESLQNVWIQLETLLQTDDVERNVELPVAGDRLNRRQSTLQHSNVKLKQVRALSRDQRGVAVGVGKKRQNDVQQVEQRHYPHTNIAIDFLKGLLVESGEHVVDIMTENPKKSAALQNPKTLNPQQIIDKIRKLKLDIQSLSERAQENDANNAMEKMKISQNSLGINYLSGDTIRQEVEPMIDKLRKLEQKYGVDGILLQQTLQELPQQTSRTGDKNYFELKREASAIVLGQQLLDTLDTFLDEQLRTTKDRWLKAVRPYFDDVDEKNLPKQSEDLAEQTLQEYSENPLNLSDQQIRAMATEIHNEEMGYCYYCFHQRRKGNTKTGEPDEDKLSYTMCCGAPLHTGCLKYDYQTMNPGSKIPSTQMLCPVCTFGPIGFINEPQNSIRNIREHFGRPYKPLEESAAFSERVASMTESLGIDSSYNTAIYQQMIDAGMLAIPAKTKVVKPLFNFVNRDRVVPRKQLIQQYGESADNYVERLSKFDKPLQYMLGNIFQAANLHGNYIPYRLDEMSTSHSSMAKMIEVQRGQNALISSLNTSAISELIPTNSKLTPQQFQFAVQNYLQDYFQTLQSEQEFDNLLPMLSYRDFFDFEEGIISNFKPIDLNQFGVAKLRNYKDGKFGEEQNYFQGKQFNVNAQIFQIEPDHQMQFEEVKATLESQRQEFVMQGLLPDQPMQNPIIDNMVSLSVQPPLEASTPQPAPQSFDQNDPLTQVFADINRRFGIAEANTASMAVDALQQEIAQVEQQKPVPPPALQLQTIPMMKLKSGRTINVTRIEQQPPPQIVPQEPVVQAQIPVQQPIQQAPPVEESKERFVAVDEDLEIAQEYEEEKKEEVEIIQPPSMPAPVESDRPQVQSQPVVQQQQQSTPQATQVPVSYVDQQMISAMEFDFNRQINEYMTQLLDIRESKQKLQSELDTVIIQKDQLQQNSKIEIDVVKQKLDETIRSTEALEQHHLQTIEQLKLAQKTRDDYEALSNKYLDENLNKEQELARLRDAEFRYNALKAKYDETNKKFEDKQQKYTEKIQKKEDYIANQNKKIEQLQKKIADQQAAVDEIKVNYEGKQNLTDQAKQSQKQRMAELTEAYQQTQKNYDEQVRLKENADKEVKRLKDQNAKLFLEKTNYENVNLELQQQVLRLKSTSEQKVDHDRLEREFVQKMSAYEKSLQKKLDEISNIGQKLNASRVRAEVMGLNDQDIESYTEQQFKQIQDSLLAQQSAIDLQMQNFTHVTQQFDQSNPNVFPTYQRFLASKGVPIQQKSFSEYMQQVSVPLQQQHFELLNQEKKIQLQRSSEIQKQTQLLAEIFQAAQISQSRFQAQSVEQEQIYQKVESLQDQELSQLVMAARSGDASAWYTMEVKMKAKQGQMEQFNKTSIEKIKVIDDVTSRMKSDIEKYYDNVFKMNSLFQSGNEIAEGLKQIGGHRFADKIIMDLPADSARRYSLPQKFTNHIDYIQALTDSNQFIKQQHQAVDTQAELIKSAMQDQAKILRQVNNLKDGLNLQITKANETISQLLEENSSIFDDLDEIDEYTGNNFEEVKEQVKISSKKIKEGAIRSEEVLSRMNQQQTKFATSVDLYNSQMQKVGKLRESLTKQIQDFKIKYDGVSSMSQIFQGFSIPPTMAQMNYGEQIDIFKKITDKADSMSKTIKMDMAHVDQLISDNQEKFLILTDAASKFKQSIEKFKKGNIEARTVIREVLNVADVAFVREVQQLDEFDKYLKIDAVDQIEMTVPPDRISEFLHAKAENLLNRHRVVVERMNATKSAIDIVKRNIGDETKKQTELRALTIEQEKLAKEAAALSSANAIISGMNETYKYQIEQFNASNFQNVDQSIRDLLESNNERFRRLPSGLMYSVPLNQTLAGIGVRHPVATHLNRAEIIEDMKRVSQDMRRKNIADGLIPISADGLQIRTQQGGPYKQIAAATHDEINQSIQQLLPKKFNVDFVFQQYKNYHDPNSQLTVDQAWLDVSAQINKMTEMKTLLQPVSQIVQMKPHVKIIDDYMQKIMENTIYSSCILLSSPNIKLAPNATADEKAIMTDEIIQNQNNQRAQIRQQAAQQVQKNVEVIGKVKQIADQLFAMSQQIYAFNQTRFVDPGVKNEKLSPQGEIGQSLSQYLNILQTNLKMTGSGIGSSFAINQMDLQGLVNRGKEFTNSILRTQENLIENKSMQDLIHRLANVGEKYNMRIRGNGVNQQDVVLKLKNAYETQIMDSFIKIFRLERDMNTDQFVDQVTQDFTQALQRGNIPIDQRDLSIENMKELAKYMRQQFPDSFMQSFRKSLINNNSDILNELDDATIINMIGKDITEITRSLADSEDNLEELAEKRKERKQKLYQNLPKFQKLNKQAYDNIVNKIANFQPPQNANVEEERKKVKTKVDKDKLQVDIFQRRQFPTTIYGLGQSFDKMKQGKTLLEEAFSQIDVTTFSRSIAQAQNMQAVNKVMDTAKQFVEKVQHSKSEQDTAAKLHYRVPLHDLSNQEKEFIMRQVDIHAQRPGTRQSLKRLLENKEQIGDRVILGGVILDNAEKIYAERGALFAFMGQGDEGSIIPLTQIREAKAEQALIYNAFTDIENALEAATSKGTRQQAQKYLEDTYKLSTEQATAILDMGQDMTSYKNRFEIILQEYDALIETAKEANEILMDHDMDIMQDQMEKIQSRLDGFDQAAAFNRATDNLMNKFKSNLENIFVKTGLDDAYGEEEKNYVKRAADNMFPRINHGRGQGVGGSYTSGQQQQPEPRRPLMAYNNSPAMQQHQGGGQQQQQQQQDQNQEGKGFSKRVIDAASKMGTITRKDVEFLKSIKTDSSGKFILEQPGGQTRELTSEEKKRLIKLLTMIMCIIYVKLYEIVDKDEEERLKKKVGGEISKNQEKGSTLMKTLDKLAAKYLEAAQNSDV